MPLHHDDVLVTDQHNAAEIIHELPHPLQRAKNGGDGLEGDDSFDEKKDRDATDLDPDTTAFDADEYYLDATGREKVLETAEDFSTHLVSLDDDPDMYVNTFRMWFAGIGLSAFGAVLGMLFQFRPQVILVSALFLQLIAFMIGKVFEQVIPGPGSRWWKDNTFWRFMNPGPFSLKEHVAAQIMANTASVTAVACLVFASDDLFYSIIINPGNAIFTLLASQLIGYGFAGIFRSFLVYPTYMLYPQNLIYVNLFDVLHRSQGELLQGKRLKFFWTVTGLIFVYEWFPEYIAPLLSSINIVCLAVRDSSTVTNLFGGAEGNEGLGLLGFGLDWANIGSVPFYQPLSTQIGFYVGWLMNYIILPLVFYKNVWGSLSLPFISQNLFLANGTVYDQKKILTADFALNRTAYEAYGAPRLAGTHVIFNLGISMSIGATMVHIALWYGADILAATRAWLAGRPIDDLHYRKMLVYREVPTWWYGLITLGASATAMVCIYTEHSQLPWWALIVALLIAIITLPFYGAMNAVAAWTPGMTFLYQMLAGALIPGSSQANMYFELYSGTALSQASSMLSDLKLGQYTKLPPRWTFTVQCVGTVVGALLNYVIMQAVLNSERKILLSNEGTRVWSGQHVQSYNANAILWGALGKEIYGPSGPYFIVPIGIVIGLFLPVFPWLLYKKYGWSWLKLINTAVLSNNIGDLAGGTNGYINTWMAIGLFSHFYLRKYRAGWFRKYNYLLGAAVDGGSQIFVFIFSFAVAGAGGKATPFPVWALNPEGNADYCKVTTT